MPKYYEVGRTRLRAKYDATTGGYIVTNQDTKQPLTHAMKVGSRWVTTAFPGKKWTTMEQAVLYFGMQRGVGV